MHRANVVSMIGASGSGKSTLLRCINYLEVPSAGAIFIDGESLGFREDRTGRRTPRPLREINRMRRDLGVVFQQFNLWPHMTVLGNIIEAPIRVLGMSRKDAVRVADECLRRVRLVDKANEYPARLSGGQQQRAAIARALAMQPQGDAVRRADLVPRPRAHGRGSERHAGSRGGGHDHDRRHA